MGSAAGDQGVHRHHHRRPGQPLGERSSAGSCLGAIEVLLQAYLPDGALPYRDALALLIVVVIIVVRPQGLLGRPAESV